jgi:KipI family sensor histidine kinase inhibitor
MTMANRKEERDSPPRTGPAARESAGPRAVAGIDAGGATVAPGEPGADHTGAVYPRFLPAGDGGLIVELGNVVDEHINCRVIALDQRIAAERIDGVLETVPTYRSLLLLYEPARIRASQLIARLRDMMPFDEVALTQPRRWVFPAVYGGDFGMDLDHVAQRHQMTTEEVIQLHSGAEYRVYMIGFAPGFTYLGGLPPALATPRRTNPRARTPAGSVSLGGIQAAISSVEVPSGWHMLGRTPARTFDLRREQPFLLKVGDLVRFRRISIAEFDRLSVHAEQGGLVAECAAGAVP